MQCEGGGKTLQTADCSEERKLATASSQYFNLHEISFGRTKFSVALRKRYIARKPRANGTHSTSRPAGSVIAHNWELLKIK